MNTKNTEGGQGRNALLLSVGASVLLQALPFQYYQYIAWPLMLLSTFAHEMGHGIAATLTGGDFLSFKMFADGSGVASSIPGGGRVADAIVSAGGLVGPALLAAILFFFGRRAERGSLALGVLGALFLLADILVVRNLFGLVFVGAVGAACLALWRLTSAETGRFFAVFIAVQLALSVFTRGDYLFTEFAEGQIGKMPSDVAQMQNALFLPYWFWGLVCGAFSVLVLLLGVRAIWTAEAKTSSGATQGVIS
jgi:hypothetical protein